MAFSYTAGSDTPLDLCRFNIGDTEEGAGALPAGKNIQDEEITRVIDEEGGSWRRAVAALFEVLAANWQREASRSVGGQFLQLSTIANGYRAQAKLWRERYGHMGTHDDPESEETEASVGIGSIDLGYIET